MRKDLLYGAILLGVFLLAGAPGAFAVSTPILGWAWGSMPVPLSNPSGSPGGVGWISFNSNDSGAGGGPYSVLLDTVSGALTGYAWSAMPDSSGNKSGIGWIKFGNLGTPPLGGSSNATINMSTGAVSGWARACAGTTGGDCVSASRTDGWDGWIELAGTNHATGDLTGNGGVTLNLTTGAFTGYAWGGPTIGWVQFNNPTNPSAGAKISPSALGVQGSCNPAAPSVSALNDPGSFTFVATASNGSGTYDYSWDGGVTATTTNQDIIRYSSPDPSAGPILEVRDHSGPGTWVPASPNCGGVVVNTGGSGPMSLAVGRTNTTANELSLNLTRGQSFYVSWWTDDVPSTYTCSPSVLPSPGAQTDWTGWTGLSAATFKTSGATTSALTTNAHTPTGPYTLRLVCTDSGNGSPYISTTRVVVTSTGENEI